ncbi:MAG: NAD(P)-dependent oxidoreductase [Hyphomicrobiaceae bacterium]
MTTTRPRIGFIGLGLMGQAFTRRLIDCGYDVTGFDVAAEQVAAAGRHGVKGAVSPADVARNSDIIQFSVNTERNLEQAVFGPNGVLSAGGAARIIVDHSTVSAEATVRLAKRVADEAGSVWIDAPVSGGPPGAETGTLAIMVGGESAAISQVAPLLTDLGKWTHMGPTGAGQVTKMVNQIIVLTNFCVLAEALTLAEAGGVDAAKLPEALGGGYAGSALLQRLFPRMLARDFTPASVPTVALKDLRMVGELASALNVPTPMSGQAEALFRLLVSKGYAGFDQSAVLKIFDPKETL